MAEVKIRTYGHACFMLESAGYKTVIDPYNHGKVPGLPNLDLEAQAVYCSHNHDDHGCTAVVTLVDNGKKANYTVANYETAHDDQGGKLRGMNMVRIFDFGGLRIAHLGDIGCEPDDELMVALKGIDCLLIPVGGFFTIDALQAKKIVDAVNPKVCIPMHYRTDSVGFGVIGHLDQFTKLFDSVNTAVNDFVLTKQTPNQILVLEYKP